MGIENLSTVYGFFARSGVMEEGGSDSDGYRSRKKMVSQNHLMSQRRHDMKKGRWMFEVNPDTFDRRNVAPRPVLKIKSSHRTEVLPATVDS